MGYRISMSPCWLQGVSKATNRDEERCGVVFEHRIGVLTGDRRGGVCRTPSPREHTRAWRAGTHLQQMLIETSCAIGISGGVKAAPLGIRHGQGRLEIKLAAGQPFNDEHGAGANRTSPMSVVSGSFAQCALSRSRQRDSVSPRLRLAKSPKWPDADQPFRE